LQGEGPNTPPAVQIGFADHAKDYYDILINLSDHVPEFFQQFNRTCEIVSNEEQYKLHKRKNFLFYKQKNLQIITHEISK
jgi:DNA polymerase-3 subunit chi